MYKVYPDRGGWSVFWLASPDAEPVQVPRPVMTPADEEHKFEPYSKRQAAYRRVKKLNDLIKQTDKLIEEGGGAIIL